MSNVYQETELNPSNDEKKLWEQLEIDFILESRAFLDNKLYGTITIKPQEARELIKNFVLVANDTTRKEFAPNLLNIVATGFDPTRTNSWVYIEAVPIKRNLSNKKSKLKDFSIVRQRLSLTPTITIDWLPPDETKPTVILRWLDIGDKIAQAYILYLDKKEIQYIPHQADKDAYAVYMRYFEPGTDHTLQLKARLKNGQETYQSDVIFFTVPKVKNRYNTEIINIIERPSEPSNVQENTFDIETDQKATTESPIEKPSIPKKPDPILPCGCHKPHETFPGIDHYLTTTGISQSSFVDKEIPEPTGRNKSPDEEETEDSESEDHSDDTA